MASFKMKSSEKEMGPSMINMCKKQTRIHIPDCLPSDCGENPTVDTLFNEETELKSVSPDLGNEIGSKKNLKPGSSRQKSLPACKRKLEIDCDTLTQRNTPNKRSPNFKTLQVFWENKSAGKNKTLYKERYEAIDVETIDLGKPVAMVICKEAKEGTASGCGTYSPMDKNSLAHTKSLYEKVAVRTSKELTDGYSCAVARGPKFSYRISKTTSYIPEDAANEEPITAAECNKPVYEYDDTATPKRKISLKNRIKEIESSQFFGINKPYKMESSLMPPPSDIYICEPSSKKIDAKRSKTRLNKGLKQKLFSDKEISAEDLTPPKEYILRKLSRRSNKRLLSSDLRVYSQLPTPTASSNNDFNKSKVNLDGNNSGGSLKETHLKTLKPDGQQRLEKYEIDIRKMQTNEDKCVLEAKKENSVVNDKDILRSHCETSGLDCSGMAVIGCDTDSYSEIEPLNDTSIWSAEKEICDVSLKESAVQVNISDISPILPRPTEDVNLSRTVELSENEMTFNLSMFEVSETDTETVNGRVADAVHIVVSDFMDLTDSNDENEAKTLRAGIAGKSLVKTKQSKKIVGATEKTEPECIKKRVSPIVSGPLALITKNVHAPNSTLLTSDKIENELTGTYSMIHKQEYDISYINPDMSETEMLTVDANNSIGIDTDIKKEVDHFRSPESLLSMSIGKLGKKRSEIYSVLTKKKSETEKTNYLSVPVAIKIQSDTDSDSKNCASLIAIQHQYQKANNLNLSTLKIERRDQLDMNSSDIKMLDVANENMKDSESNSCMLSNQECMDTTRDEKLKSKCNFIVVKDPYMSPDLRCYESPRFTTDSLRINYLAWSPSEDSIKIAESALTDSPDHQILKETSDADQYLNVGPRSEQQENQHNVVFRPLTFGKDCTDIYTPSPKLTKTSEGDGMYTAVRLDDFNVLRSTQFKIQGNTTIDEQDSFSYWKSERMINDPIIPGFSPSDEQLTGTSTHLTASPAPDQESGYEYDESLDSTFRLVIDTSALSDSSFSKAEQQSSNPDSVYEHSPEDRTPQVYTQFSELHKNQNGSFTSEEVWAEPHDQYGATDMDYPDEALLVDSENLQQGSCTQRICRKNTNIQRSAENTSIYEPPQNPKLIEYEPRVGVLERDDTVNWKEIGAGSVNFSRIPSSTASVYAYHAWSNSLADEAKNHSKIDTHYPTRTSENPCVALNLTCSKNKQTFVLPESPFGSTVSYVVGESIAQPVALNNTVSTTLDINAPVRTVLPVTAYMTGLEDQDKDHKRSDDDKSSSSNLFSLMEESVKKRLITDTNRYSESDMPSNASELSEELKLLRPYVISGWISSTYLIALMKKTDLVNDMFGNALNEDGQIKSWVLENCRKTNPAVLAKDLIFRLFTLDELNNLKMQKLSKKKMTAIKNCLKKTFPTKYTPWHWRSKCLPLIKSSVKTLFEHRVRHIKEFFNIHSKY